MRDELLSSWLARLAKAHRLKLHTFCSITWPNKQIWNRDIDKSADKEIVEVLSAKSGASIKRVQATTLAAYEGIVYEKYTRFGPTSWVMPIGVYHRTRTQFGLQYCPFCLSEDKEPYFRRKWRLAFIVSCEKHETLLHDRCPCCGIAVNFHRDEMGDHRKFFAQSLTLCHICRFDLRRIDGLHITYVTRRESKFTLMLLRAVDAGFMQLNASIAIYSQLFFAGLRQLMKIAAMKNNRVAELRRAISEEYRIEVYTPSLLHSHEDVPEMDIKARRLLLGTVRCLLEEWPHRFIELSQKHKLWSSLWLRHVDPPTRNHVSPAPFWLWSVVHNYLYRAKYQPSDEEVKAAVNYLKKNGERVNKSNLARLLGLSVVRSHISV